MGINKEVWSTIAEDNLFAKTPLITVADTSFEGELKYGNAVNVYTYPQGAVSIINYDGNTPITTDRVKPSTVKLLVDQAKAFALRVDSIDVIQNSPDTLMKNLDNVLQSMREEIQEFLLTKIKTKVVTNVINLSTLKLDKDNIVSLFEEINIALDEANASKDRFVFVDPRTASILRQAKLVEVFAVTNNGTVGPTNIYKFGDNIQVLESSLIKGDGTTIEFVAGTKDLINFVGQIETLESFKPEGYFGEAVKGLFVFGSEIFNEKKGVKLIFKDHKAL